VALPAWFAASTRPLTAISTQRTQLLVFAAYFRKVPSLAATDPRAWPCWAPAMGSESERYSRPVAARLDRCSENRQRRKRPEPGQAALTAKALRSRFVAIALTVFAAYPIFENSKPATDGNLNTAEREMPTRQPFGGRFLVGDAEAPRSGCGADMSKPALVCGLVDVAKPIPMGQSDWPLRFDDAPSFSFGQSLAQARITRTRSTEEHVPARRRVGGTGDVSG
jgi:hypothetical protein